MLSGVQCNASWHLLTPSRPLRSVIEQTILDVLAAAAGVTRFIRLLSHAVKTNMPPKTIRNLGDKSEGVKTTRIGRDKGETVGRAQDSLPAHITPSSEINVLGKEPIPPCTSDKKSFIENKEFFIKTTQYVESLSEIEDSNREISEKVLGLPGSRQSETQQVDQSEQLECQSKEGTVSTSVPTVEKDDLTNPLGSPKKWDKVTGKDPQLMDWGKDSSDKFYSLTEESDLSSVDRSFSESEGSETSEAGNKSPSNELTVRQYRQRKLVKTRPGSQEGFENAASMSTRTLKWDYSGIGLADIPTISTQGPVNDKIEIDTGASAGNAGNAYAMGTEAGILQSIYSSIKELQTETRIESRRARIATKRLQGTVRKVAKYCTEIEAKLCSMEERIVAVEEDVDTLKEQSAARDGQLTDVMWKMEDLENRQRRNNLRFLGIPEGLEGSNIQAYMVNLLR
ncbi:hypothetical protein NDU88_000959 [Pleurodeles waltl]|uniref:Uncharacterized protein n=1 Tax=Pleurodeles waltl TaxID=8319 RepID=A0AAV7SYT2_PLEWA|nr:hypothetical protein NDU88_000959 [Pleurodeles waltl]